VKVFDHFWLKILALAGAAIFWVAISSERSERVFEKAYDVPIVFGAIPQHLIVTAAPFDTVRVRLRGRESLLSTVSSQTLEATVDLAEARAGDITAILRPQALNLPAGIEVVSMDPAKVTFTLEPKRQKVVPIRPFVGGDPPPGVQLTSVACDPVNALLSGPASVIRDITEVSTERVLVTSRSQTFSSSVGVVSDRALVRVLEPLNTRVTVQLEAVAPPATDSALDTAATSTAPVTSTSGGESARIGRPGESRKNETTVRN
jgi:YbbR domain-containing protein